MMASAVENNCAVSVPELLMPPPPPHHHYHHHHHLRDTPEATIKGITLVCIVRVVETISCQAQGKVAL